MEVKVVYTNVHENRRAPLCRGMCRIVPNCCKQLAIEDKMTTRAFRGIRLCHGVVNGCLTKKRNIFNHAIKTMAKKPKSFLFDLKRKEKCFIQPYNGLEARILFRSEEHTSELQSHLN